MVARLRYRDDQVYIQPQPERRPTALRRTGAVDACPTLSAVKNRFAVRKTVTTERRRGHEVAEPFGAVQNGRHIPSGVEVHEFPQMIGRG